MYSDPPELSESPESLSDDMKGARSGSMKFKSMERSGTTGLSVCSRFPGSPGSPASSFWPASLSDEYVDESRDVRCEDGFDPVTYSGKCVYEYRDEGSEAGIVRVTCSHPLASFESISDKGECEPDRFLVSSLEAVLDVLSH